MKCIVCGKDFFICKNIYTLFKPQEQIICNSCKPRMIRVEILRFAIYEYEILIYVCGDFDNKKYIFDYSYTYEYLIKSSRSVLIYDTLYLNDETYEELYYHILINLDKSLVILCNGVKN